MKSRGLWQIVLVIITGGIIGSALGNFLGGKLPFLHSSKFIGISPTTIDLSFLNFTFGLSINLNLATVLGLLIALVLIRRF